MSLLLYDRPAEGTTYRANIDGIFETWRRTNRAVGGYYIGKMTIKDRGMPQLTDFYNTWLGMKIVETTFGMVTWEGLIWQLDLYKGGVNYRRTLNKDVFHNRVKVYYTDTNGDQQTIAWSANTDSSGIYGVTEMIYTLNVEGDTAATAERDSKLTQYAWPISRQVGSLTLGINTQQKDGLYITCVGFWGTLNNEYYESSTSGDGDAVISTLVGTSEFVTAGRLEDNSGLSDAVADGTTIPKRTGEFIEDIISRGDNSGNIWIGGVYNDQEFVYEPAPTTIDYILRNGRLYDKAGVMVVPETLRAGFYIRDTNAPAGYQPPGSSNIWDDPQVSWVDEVEFEYPNILRLNFPGEPVTPELGDIPYPNTASGPGRGGPVGQGQGHPPLIREL